MTSQHPTRHVVVVGGGIVGTATCYFLMNDWNIKHGNNNADHSNSNNKLRITLIERTSIACHASGKAGGFLARNWCDDSKLGALAQKSFALHSKLANKFGKERILYRSMKAYQMQTDNKKPNSQKNNNIDTQWLDCNINYCEQIAEEKNGAQCHPKELCNLFVELCQKRGQTSININSESNSNIDEKKSDILDNNNANNFEFNIIFGNVANLLFNKNESKVIAIQYSPTKAIESENDKTSMVLLECSDIVLAMGPWTHTAFHWFPKRLQQLQTWKQISKIKGSKHNSIVLELDSKSDSNNNNNNNTNQNEKH